VLADERLTVLGLFAETWASLTARANAHLAGFGISGAEFEVCLRLARSPEGLLRMSDLAAQTALTSSGITRVVDRLVERGLVSRRSCATDRRTTYAVISDSGRAFSPRCCPGTWPWPRNG
jgi:DNA-binding MarR family transcriptional regulator